MLRARGKPVAQLSNLGGMKVGAVVGTVVGTALTLYRSGLPKRGIGSVSHGKEALDMLQGGSLDTSLAPINRFDVWRAKNPKHQLRRGSYVHTAHMNTGFVARADAPDVLAAASKVTSSARADGQLQRWTADAGATWTEPSTPNIYEPLGFADLVREQLRLAMPL